MIGCSSCGGKSNRHTGNSSASSHHHNRNDNAESNGGNCNPRCRKPRCCKSNNVNLGYIVAHGVLASGAPTSACTSCEYYLQRCNCVLWKCVDGIWTTVTITDNKWYFCETATQIIWKIIPATNCTGLCTRINIGDKSCDQDLFIDSHACTIYKYHRCKWYLKADCSGTVVFFTTIEDQKLNIVTTFNSVTAVTTYEAIDPQGNPVIVGNAYYETSTGNLYTYTNPNWSYITLPTSTTYIVDIWGTFLAINDGTVSAPRQGDVLIDGSDCTFYSWDECTSGWLFQTTFNCGDGEQGPPGEQGEPGVQGSQGVQGVQGSQGVQGAPGIQGVDGLQGEQGVQGVAGIDGTDGTPGTPAGTDDPILMTLTRQTAVITERKMTNYPAVIRGTLNVPLNLSGDFTIPTDAVYSLRWDLDVVFLADGSEISVPIAIVLNDDLVSGRLAETTVFRHNITDPVSNSEVAVSLATNALLSAGDTIALYFINPVVTTLEVIWTVSILQMIQGTLPT